VIRSRTTAVLVAGLALGILIRLAVAVAADGTSFSDNAVVALMAMHALSGKLYAFYWGQSYMGSLESIVVAPFFAMLGANDVALSAGLLPWYALYAAACFAIARRLGGERAGMLALAFCALAPCDVQFFEVTARGGYPATIAFGTILLWLSLRFAYDPLPPRSRSLHVVAIGFVAGLAFWTNWLVFPYFVVCAVLLIARDPRLPIRPAAWVALAAFVAGSLPLWIYNARHGFATFALVDVPLAPDVFTSLVWSATHGVPNILGVRDLHGVWAFGPIGRLLAAALVLASLHAIARLRPSWTALARGRVVDADPIVVPWLLALATVGVYVLCLPSRFQIGRYLLPITTSATVLLAVGIASLGSRRPVAGAAAFVMLAAFYAATTLELARDFASSRARYTAGPVDDLVPRLEKLGVRYGYASYADAAISTYIAGERVVLSDYEERYYPLDEVDFRDPALVLADAEPTAATSLAAVNAAFVEHRVPGYRVYWPARYDGLPRRPLPRDRWRVTASTHAEDASLMLDGDPWTVWSVHPRPEQPPAVTIDLGAEQPVAGIYFALGEAKRDGFRRVRIEASPDGREWRLVKEAKWDFPVHFRADGRLSVLPDDVQMVLFAPERARWLRAELGEPNPRRNWTIGELEVYGLGDDTAKLRDPALGDPRSPALAEPRLRREIDRLPTTNRPYVALAKVYEERGDVERRAEIERLEHDRFTPRTLLNRRFGRAIRLLGHDASVVGPRELEINYYWRADRVMANAYAMSGHFEGPRGFRFQDDYVIGAPANTTDGWIAGEIVKETRRIAVPADAPVGRYRFTVGVWNPSTGERLPLGPWWHAGHRSELLELDVERSKLAVSDR